MPIFKVPLYALSVSASLLVFAPALADTFSFGMIPSTAAAAAGCLSHGKASVTITSSKMSDNLNVRVSGLPARTSFDLFVTQVPDAPFGVSWYLGRLQTNDNGT